MSPVMLMSPSPTISLNPIPKFPPNVGVASSNTETLSLYHSDPLYLKYCPFTGDVIDTSDNSFIFCAYVLKSGGI